eukprot:842222-Prymnesium_polylepis.2
MQFQPAPQLFNWKCKEHFLLTGEGNFRAEPIRAVTSAHQANAHDDNGHKRLSDRSGHDIVRQDGRHQSSAPQEALRVPQDELLPLQPLACGPSVAFRIGNSKLAAFDIDLTNQPPQAASPVACKQEHQHQLPHANKAWVESEHARRLQQTAVRLDSIEANEGTQQSRERDCEHWWRPLDSSKAAMSTTGANVGRLDVLRRAATGRSALLKAGCNTQTYGNATMESSLNSPCR